jgi:hypothetical protein
LARYSDHATNYSTDKLKFVFLDTVTRFKGGVAAGNWGTHEVMQDIEVKRLRKEISRTFGSQPHKKKYWLALLEMYQAKENGKQSGGGIGRGNQRRKSAEEITDRRALSASLRTIIAL